MTEICHILSYLLEKEERKKTAIVEFRISATIYLRHKLIACFFRAVDIAYPGSFYSVLNGGFHMTAQNQLVSHFLSHRNVTIELAEKISREHYDYKPAETSMSAQELVKHIVYSFLMFANVINDGNGSAIQNKPKEEAETDLVKLAEACTEKTTDILSQLTEEQLNRKIDLTASFGRKVTGAALFQLAMEHEIHHKGNLFVYVREMGYTELPFYQQKS